MKEKIQTMLGDIVVRLYSLVAIMFVACGSKTGKAVSETDSLAVDSTNGSVVDKYSEAYIRQRIDTMELISSFPAMSLRARRISTPRT